MPRVCSTLAAPIMMDALMIKVSEALTMASLRCNLPSALPQPLLFRMRGRLTKVGEDMVVPTKAAMKRRASADSGMRGIKPLNTVPGAGSSMNMDRMNARPIRVTRTNQMVAAITMAIPSTIQ